MYYVGLVAYLPTGLRVAQPCRYCFTQWSKILGVFAPQGRHVAPINVKFGTGAKMWEYSPKTVKISNFGQKFLPQGRLGCNIFTKFSAFVRVYS